MAKSKATITIDKAKMAKAAELIGGRSMSEVIDTALERLIQTEQLRRDIAAYRRQPPTEEERAFGNIPMKLDLGDDDVDYDALYGTPE
jgi:hypothetical protein